ncbi:ABC transporter permease subunit [Thiohalophilus sp.]|uniref:ABC transporter permease subunit n=1 Tax=Thiohalophilus sp. TaxID=3028392 RepID=UPI002ACE1863|nr:ABC transporter permease subunit [Thiohalophilus sp.]MDZ7663627.1 ABC transporter permease subunit [Thiohalophilus sp.]
MQDPTTQPLPADSAAPDLLPSKERRLRLRRWRNLKDGLSRYSVGIGGGGVVFALALMFIYLFSEVAPMFSGADIELRKELNISGLTGAAPADIGYAAVERYEEVGVVYGLNGKATLVDMVNARTRSHIDLPLPTDTTITSFAAGEPRSNVVAYGLSDGSALIAEHAFGLEFEGDVRHINGEIEYPLGKEPVVVDDKGYALTYLAVQKSDTGYAIAARTADGRLLMKVLETSSNFMTGEVEVTPYDVKLSLPPGEIAHMLVDNRLLSLFVFDKQGQMHYYDVSERDPAPLVESVRVVPEGEQVTAAEFLVGTVSLIVGGSDGSVSQWFLIRDDKNIYHPTFVRDFPAHSAAITAIGPEHPRKGFATGDANGNLAIHFATSENTVLERKLFDEPIRHISFTPPNKAMLVVDDHGKAEFYSVDNEHPDVSWSVLWEKVWYEGRSEPEYIWQASSGTDEFEPKYSLVPLSLGTLKAAFYAMLFAMPLAILAAIYTAYFMSPKLRGYVKPTIEVMEALPTVILGFLAGLWLAPYMENNLPAIFSILILMPLAFLIIAGLWQHMPVLVRRTFPPGWEAVALIPIIFLVGWVCVVMSPYVELWFFDGSMRQWLTDVGITYDQRNAMVVGVAMGFAVIPTIYSIAEDAIFSVPKHLTQGSLALGATPMQTVVGVVLPTASPGIFSALMIGFGRAIGETMIVLMATGNSPIMNFNIFEGMRTLSANIAVELPETAVHSSHYRILFLAALVLFIFTFIINTVAEVVRQRLRRRYASL